MDQITRVFKSTDNCSCDSCDYFVETNLLEGNCRFNPPTENYQTSTVLVAKDYWCGKWRGTFR